MKENRSIDWKFEPNLADWIVLASLASITFWLIFVFFDSSDGHALGAALAGAMIMSIACLVAEYRTVNQFSIVELFAGESLFVGLHGLAAVIYSQLGNGNFLDLFLLDYDRLIGEQRISLLFFAPSAAILVFSIALVKRSVWVLHKIVRGGECSSRSGRREN